MISWIKNLFKTNDGPSCQLCNKVIPRGKEQWVDYFGRSYLLACPSCVRQRELAQLHLPMPKGGTGESPPR